MNEKTYKCECGKEFTYSQAYNGHRANCTVYHELKFGSCDKLKERRKKQAEAASINGQQRHELVVKQKEDRLQQWIDEKHTCRRCGKVMTEKFGPGIFCSYSCSNSKPAKKKTIKCEKCGVEFIADIRHKPLCDTCKKIEFKSKQLCKVCGSIGCTKEFCHNGNRALQFKTLTKYFGFNSEYIGTADVFSEWDRVRQLLIKEYWIDGKTANQIAEEYNYPGGDNLLTHVFPYMNIETKSVSQGLKDGIASGRITFPESNTYYKHG